MIRSEPRGAKDQVEGRVVISTQSTIQECITVRGYRNHESVTFSHETVSMLESQLRTVGNKANPQRYQ